MAKKTPKDPGSVKIIAYLEGIAHTNAGLDKQEVSESVLIKSKRWEQWRRGGSGITPRHLRLFAYAYGLDWKKLCKKAFNLTGETKWQKAGDNTAPWEGL